MDIKEILNLVRDALARWFDSFAYGVKTYRAWVLAGAVLLSVLLIVWARSGFTVDFSRYSASEPSYVAESCWISGEHGCCAQVGGGDNCINQGKSIDFGATPDCKGGCFGSPQFCGPSIPAGGDFAWSFEKNNNWDINCRESGSNINNQEEFFIGADVGACHPDGLHLVWRAIHRPKATCGQSGVAGTEMAEGSGIRTEYTEGSFIRNNDWDDLKSGGARMYFDPKAANCGSVQVYGAFWADPPPEAYKHNLAGNTGWNVVLNYGRDCTGAPGEIVPGGTGTTGGGSPGTPGGSSLAISCGDDANVITWTGGGESTSLQRGNTGLKNLSECADYWCWIPSQAYEHEQGEGGAYTYIDDQLQAGACYEYRVKSDVLEYSNTVLCPNSCGEPEPSESPEPTETPTGTSSPTPTPVVVTVTPTPRTSGTPLPGTGNLRMVGAIRNVSDNGTYRTSTTARPSQEVMVRMSLEALQTIPNVIVSSGIPDTSTYVPGTTRIDGAPTSVDSIIGSGIALGSLTGRHEVTFVIEVKSTSALPEGTRTSTVSLRAQGDGVSSVTDTVTLVVNNVSQVGTAGTTETGPGDMTVLALLASALVTLLYVSYTHTTSYRSREVSTLSKKRDPMDFQN